MSTIAITALVVFAIVMLCVLCTTYVMADARSSRIAGRVLVVLAMLFVIGLVYVCVASIRGSWL